MLEALTREVDTAAATSTAATPPAAATPPMRLGARDATHAGWVLGPGEERVWEGRPSALGLATGAFRLPIVAAYFGALVAWGLVETVLGRAGIDAVAIPLATGILTLGALFGTATLLARTTTYLVTTDRVILRYGAVLSRSLSIPFRQVAAMSLSVRRGGRGDIAFTLRAGNRIPYLKLWPHARPWRMGHPEPMLRDVPDAALMATGLTRRLRA